HARQRCPGFRNGRLLEDRGERRPSIFGIKVDLAIEQRLVSKKSSSKIETPLHFHFEAMLQMLRGNLPENNLFREVLRCAPDGALRVRASASARPQQRDQARANFRSIHPRPPSASSARSAAGTAPARICVESTEATPRKINTPSPPAPIAAAIVAVP